MWLGVVEGSKTFPVQVFTFTVKVFFNGYPWSSCLKGWEDGIVYKVPRLVGGGVRIRGDKVVRDPSVGDG